MINNLFNRLISGEKINARYEEVDFSVECVGNDQMRVTDAKESVTYPLTSGICADWSQNIEEQVSTNGHFYCGLCGWVPISEYTSHGH